MRFPEISASFIPAWAAPASRRRMLCALLLQALFSIRSERLLMGRLKCNLLLARGPGRGRSGVERNGVHEKPGPLAAG